MSRVKIRGTVHVLEETKTYGAKGFRKRRIVIQDDSGQWAQHIPGDMTQDAVDLGDEIEVGDEVEVDGYLGGRAWKKDEESETKYFLDLNIVGINVLQSVADGSGPPDPDDEPTF